MTKAPSSKWMCHSMCSHSGVHQWNIQFGIRKSPTVMWTCPRGARGRTLRKTALHQSHWKGYLCLWRGPWAPSQVDSKEWSRYGLGDTTVLYLPRCSEEIILGNSPDASTGLETHWVPGGRGAREHSMVHRECGYIDESPTGAKGVFLQHLVVPFHPCCASPSSVDPENLHQEHKAQWRFLLGQGPVCCRWHRHILG